MTVQPNGTHAKDIALYFIDMTDMRATPGIVRKTIVQAKRTLEAGYTKDEIISTIDRNLEKGVNMYSFGYIDVSINDVLREIEKEKSKVEAKKVKEEIEEMQKSQRKAVSMSDESTERNREKARRVGVQSRLRKKLNFDMFEEQ